MEKEEAELYARIREEKKKKNEELRKELSSLEGEEKSFNISSNSGSYAPLSKKEKDAQKAYEKAFKAEQKRQLEDAQKEAAKSNYGLLLYSNVLYQYLCIGFLKVGCFSFGGAYGAIPLIRDVVMSYGWLNDEMLTYMIAVSESTPGPIMVNLATYIGSSQAGFWGAVVATLAVVLPSFFIILLVTALLKTALKNKYVQAVLRGLKPCVIGIVLATGIYMIIQNCLSARQSMNIDIISLVITVTLAIIAIAYKKVTKKKMSPIMLIIISAFLGLMMYAI